jgi:STE24 endopeptidase
MRLIIILLFLLQPYNELISFVMTWIGWRFELQADAFAKSLNKSAHLKSALTKLHIYNLSFPVADWLYAAWHFTHLTLTERMEALNEPKKKPKLKVYRKISSQLNWNNFLTEKKSH